ncbi:MAG: hypothetical protein IKY70_05280 [Bacteroidales bacterium]|nr:hypothetical protein [Bacteroidales bacterium]
MKTLRTLLVVAVALVMGASSAMAQGKFGPDSANCVNSMNFYRDFLKQGDIKEAAPEWRKAFKSCPPKASQNIYLHGAQIYRSLINKASADTKQGLIDTLMMIYDRRAELYPKSWLKAKQNKVLDMANYFAADDKSVFDETAEVIKRAGEELNPDLLVLQMNRAKAMYESQKISAEDVLNTYSELSPMVDAIVKADPSDNNKIRQATFENAFILSGVANCDNLISVFTPRFDANPTDLAMVKNIAKLLSDNDCLSSELFLKSVMAMHELEPSFNSARLLYRLYSSKDQNQEALKYLQEAIDSPESDDMDDAAMLFEMATFQFKKMNQYGQAVATAKAALEKDASLAGKANLLIGTIWYQVKCSGNEIEQRAKFWVATDYLQKAKNADAALAADADEMLRNCRVYYPTVEDAFMYDLQDGNSFTVSCGGMSATTTVRTTK